MTDPFYIGLAVVIVVVAAAAYVWEKGLLGTATEGRIKAAIAKAEHDLGTWQAKLKAKQEAAASTGATGTAARLAEAQKMLTDGLITQAEFDAIKARILAAV